MGRMVFGTGKSVDPVAKSAEIAEIIMRPSFEVAEEVVTVTKPSFTTVERVEKVVKPTFLVQESVEVVEKPVFNVVHKSQTVEVEQIVEKISVKVSISDLALRILLGVSAAVHLWSTFK